MVARILILHFDLADNFTEGNASLHELIRGQQVRRRVSHVVVAVLELMGETGFLIEVGELVLIMQGLLVVNALLLCCTVQPIEVAQLIHRKVLCVASSVLGLKVLWRKVMLLRFWLVLRFYWNRLQCYFWLLRLLNHHSLGFLILARLGLGIQ